MPVGIYSQRCTINTVPYMHFCVSFISAWWFILLYYNAPLFPTHLMCIRHSISERLTTYLWFQPGSVKFILFCKYSCIPLKSLCRCWSLTYDYVQNSLVPNTWVNHMSVKITFVPDRVFVPTWWASGLISNFRDVAATWDKCCIMSNFSVIL